MRIGLFEGKYKEKTRINEKRLKQNIEMLKTNSKDTITKYVLKVYDSILKNGYKTKDDIYKELKNKYKAQFLENENEISSYDVVISTSHENAYHLVKQLNVKKENLTIICFDMHCDLYNANEELWKGNHFSKLIKEGYLTNLICYGVPKYKRKMTLEQIDQRCVDKVYFADTLKGIFNYIKVHNTKHILFSIDIDCFDSYRKTYTAIPYSPYRILCELSKKVIRKNASMEELSKIAYECVYIKNRGGYENMYHVGENKFNVGKFTKVFKSITKYCSKNKILVGYEKGDLKILSDITEVYGDDINGNTLHLINVLIDVLKEVSLNEKFISKKIS